ncbi:MAG: hypothetical protein ABIQ39_02035 [Ilumatobacteraceae bacterium]
MMKPDAVAAVASKISREWGETGYSILTMTEGPLAGSAIAEVWHFDGSVFFVGADRWGNSRYADTRDLLVTQFECLAAS